MRVDVRVHNALLAAVAVAFWACAPSSSVGPDVACPLGTGPATEWRLVDLGPFSMQMPPGFEEADVQAIDSRAGIFRSARTGAEISYDYGWYSNPLPPEPSRLAERTRCLDDIGGRRATLVVGELMPTAEQQRAFVAAAAWRNVETDRQPVHLTIWSTTPDSTELDMLQAVIRSVQFK
jgi:hypothetical protein